MARAVAAAIALARAGRRRRRERRGCAGIVAGSRSFVSDVMTQSLGLLAKIVRVGCG